MSVGRRLAQALCIAMLCVLPAGAAQAEPSALEKLARRDALLGWEAVGRIDMDAGGFCTGVLYAPNLVLTAAHCVYDAQGTPHPAGELRFRAGFAEGAAIAESRVLRVFAHPGYIPSDTVTDTMIRHDAAFLELETPIPAAIAAPFSVATVPEGREVSVLSYAEGRTDVLSWQRRCAVLARVQGLVVTDCDVTFGASGAPVFERSSGRARIVSLISAGATNESGRQVALGIDLPELIAALQAELRAGRAISSAVPETAPKPGASVRRIGTGDGARDIGARFIKVKPVP
jgi:protease YdgD